MRVEGLYSFGPFQFDARARVLTRGGVVVPLSDRQAVLLTLLVAHGDAPIPKDTLVSAVWDDVAVTDNSLEQLVSSLRRVLKDAAGDVVFVETVPRRGYRMAATVTRHARREDDEALEAMLAPHRAFIEGRAALETLDRTKIAQARAALGQVVKTVPDLAAAHLGLANACIMSFETTRAEAAPDVEALETAVLHAREACRLDPRAGEAWATLGFVLARTPHRADALPAGRRAVMLEPDNWRHHLRLASIGWGEERLRAAGRALALLPGFPLAHWLAATVHVARHSFDQAVRELDAGLAAQGSVAGAEPRFSGVALHWLLGLVQLAQGDRAAALASFEREESLENCGHLYARECAGYAAYAVGVSHLAAGERGLADAALERALARVPAHPMARVALAVARREPVVVPAISSSTPHALQAGQVDAAMAAAALARWTGTDDAALAAAISRVDQALTAAPAGSDGWLLPVEPLVGASLNPSAWAPVLARLRARAA